MHMTRFSFSRNFASALAVLALTIAIMTSLPAQARPAPLSTAFTYQGQLKLSGNPVNNTADFQFTLWDALSGPNQIAGPVAVNNVTIANGLFTAQIDFGSNVFNGDARWLQIAVRSPAGSGAFTTLSPRQPLTAEPYSLQTRGIFVDNSSNVGIGTTTPTNRLTVNGNANISGNVGIGTAAPGEKLTIAGSMEVGTGAGDYQHLRIGGGNSSGFIYGSYPAFGDGVHIGYNYYADAGGADHIINPGGGSSRITVGYGAIEMAADTCPGCLPTPLLLHVSPNYSYFYNTNLGINTTLPQFALEVSGSAGKPGGGSWSNSSDIRLKKNIEPLEGALDQLLCLHGVTFEYVDPKAVNELPGQRIGMIAQDVEKVFPDWVGQRSDGYKTVTYRGFEALTVEALRDLRDEKDAQIEALRAETLSLRQEKDAQIAALQSDNQQLQDRLATLEAAVARMSNTQEKH